jgi:hypothetical protein
MPRPLEALIVIRGNGIEPDNRVSLVQQPPREMEADEACGTGDEESHGANVLLVYFDYKSAAILCILCSGSAKPNRSCDPRRSQGPVLQRDPAEELGARFAKNGGCVSPAPL